MCKCKTMFENVLEISCLVTWTRDKFILGTVT